MADQGDPPIVRYRVGPPLHSSDGDTHADLALEILGEPVDAPGDFPAALLATDPPRWLRVRRPPRVFRPDDPAPAIQREIARAFTRRGRKGPTKATIRRRLKCVLEADGYIARTPHATRQAAAAWLADHGFGDHSPDTLDRWRRDLEKRGLYKRPGTP